MLQLSFIDVVTMISSNRKVIIRTCYFTLLPIIGCNKYGQVDTWKSFRYLPDQRTEQLRYLILLGQSGSGKSVVVLLHRSTGASIEQIVLPIIKTWHHRATKNYKRLARIGDLSVSCHSRKEFHPDACAFKTADTLVVYIMGITASQADKRP
jgi:hypothetical protein